MKFPGTENLGFTHAEGAEVVLTGDGSHRKTVKNMRVPTSDCNLIEFKVKCLSHADAVEVAHFIAKSQADFPMSDEDETLCFRCKGQH